MTPAIGPNSALGSNRIISRPPTANSLLEESSNSCVISAVRATNPIQSPTLEVNEDANQYRKLLLRNSAA